MLRWLCLASLVATTTDLVGAADTVAVDPSEVLPVGPSDEVLPVGHVGGVVIPPVGGSLAGAMATTDHLSAFVVNDHHALSY